MNLIKMTDKELNDLTNEIEIEKNRRKFLNMEDNELCRVATAKNGKFSDEEAVTALNILLKKEKPNLQLLATLKQLSHSKTVRKICKKYLFG